MSNAIDVRLHESHQPAADARLRLCIVSPVHWKAFMGGAQYQIKCLLDHLCSLSRYDIHYLARRTPDCTELDGYAIHRIGDGGPAPRFGYVMDAPDLYRTLRRLRPNVIYQRVGCAYTGISAEYARRNDCGLVWHVANDTDVQRGLRVTKKNQLRDRVERALLSHGIRKATRVVTQTEQQAQLLLENFERRSDAVIPNFHPEPAEVIDKSGPPRVVWVANLKRAKQPDAFLRLVESLRDVEHVRFVMIGAGSIREGESPWHDDLMRKIAASRKVEFRGQLSQDDVNAELARAHVFVNTSLYEGFANTFIQAWMRQVPVVSLNVNPDGVFDGESVGFHSGSEQRLAEIVRRLITDPALRGSVGRRAAAYAAEHHSMRNARLLEAVIRDAASRSPRARIARASAAHPS